MRDFMLIIHFLGLAMGVGTSIGFLFLGIASSKMSKEEAQKFMLNAYAMGRMGHIGLTLLIISGGYLLTPYLSSLSEMPLLIAKLVLVLVLSVVIGLIAVNSKRAKEGNTELYMKKIEPLGKIGLLTAVATVILAVYVFH